MKYLKVHYIIQLLIISLLSSGCGSSGRTSNAVTNTGKGTSPQVTYTVTANGATDVFINSKIGAFFTTEMDPATINASTFTLKQGSTTVLGDVSYNGLGAVFTPIHNLTPNAAYTATITKQARDLAGNSLISDYVWGWKTGAG
jgi:hypothetical protein